MQQRDKAVANETGGGRDRDALVTGMGFCLPGGDEATFTADDVWDVVSHGRSCLLSDGIYHGAVTLPPEIFDKRVPDVPGIFAEHFTDAHRYGLVSMMEACADAGLEPRSGDLGNAAILAGRGGVDANIGSYLDVLRADPATMGVGEAMELFIRAEQSVTPADVAMVQGAVTRATGPCFTVAAGCASSAVQLGNARLMIANGVTDVAVVTGVDVFNLDLVRNTQGLLRLLQEAAPDAVPDVLPSLERVMRPYDRRADCVNYGEGSVTLILESRERAARRGVRPYGQILAQATTRDGLTHPLASDETGMGLVAAVRGCLGDRWDIENIPYIHGGSDGDTAVTRFETNAVKHLYGSAASGLLMTSQEACFGHNGAPAGALGAAMTLLMMRHGEVCPTANCEEPIDGLVFDPVPGTRTRRLDFDYALSFAYQIGGVKTATLLGSPDAA